MHATSPRSSPGVRATTSKATTRLWAVACLTAAFAFPPGLVVEADAQAPAPATSVKMVAFTGTTIFVSTSGVDTNPGTEGSPVRTIQRAMALANQANANGQAVIIEVAAGIYREAVDLGGQKTDAPLTIEGAGASTVLTGADDWSSGWTSAGGDTLAHAWPYRWGLRTLPSGWINFWSSLAADRDVLRRAEIVYVNGTPLKAVLSLAALAAGSFYVDEPAGKLYMMLPGGLSYPGPLIEVGVRSNPLRINGRRNISVQNLTVARSSGALQDSAVIVTNSQNITFNRVTIASMAYGGFGGAYNTGVRIYHSTINDNGVLAVSSLKDVDVVIESSEIARNNWRGAQVGMLGWDSVFKWSGVRDGVVRSTKFVNNQGNGFWLDTDNQRIRIENSFLSGHALSAISLENNPGPIAIFGNRICNNIQSGISDAQSNNVTLQKNQIFANTNWNILFTGNYQGQTSTDWQTGSTSVNRSLSWAVTENTIVGSGTGTGTTNGGWLWWHTDYNAPGAWTLIRNSFRAFDRNIWYHTNRTSSYKLPQGSVTYTSFKADIQSAQAAFESSSVYQNPGTLSCTAP